MEQEERRRLDRLEEAQAFGERAAETLSEEVAELSRRVAALGRRLEALEGRLTRAMEAGEEEEGEAKA